MSFACDCSADVDGGAEFFVEEWRKARREHKCCECGEVIKPGQKYHKAIGKWGGYFATYKTCMPCCNIREDYCSNGYVYGGLVESIRECFGFDYRNL